jgi:hypothetical protein
LAGEVIVLYSAAARGLVQETSVLVALTLEVGSRKTGGVGVGVAEVWVELGTGDGATPDPPPAEVHAVRVMSTATAADPAVALRMIEVPS